MPRSAYSRRFADSGKGFTLIELMIVIAIIAILAGILVPNFVRARAQANLSACEENLKSIATACEMYASQNDGCYPSSLNKLTPDYINKLPACPAGANATTGTTSYYYYFRVNPNGYCIHCAAMNHRPLDLASGCPNYSPFAGGLNEHMSQEEIRAKYFL